MTLRVDIARGSQTVKNETVPHIQFFDDLRSGIKLRTINITKLLFSKHRVNMTDSCVEQIETPGFVAMPHRSDCTAGQMDGEPGLVDHRGNIGLPSLAGVMGMGRQQQQIETWPSL